ncbi:hypothetical protein BKA70DRAFT_1140452 [Coprinopsis sp. MPI-PUGE-AT-0042]|nr:hypothetical protein BKA70DRAFT_1163573 [Coprinopsis sp. MPI-PUGE-AT-0042]KAH6916313.1 hypothetical protein BKA70DRAFT_1140452 [Coprinopsis sp. MPI-PUGE-AT-0042]
MEQILEMSGFRQMGGPERNVEAYKALAKLRAMMPTRSQKVAQPPPRKMTNAERLTKGLPLNPPVRKQTREIDPRRQASPGPPVTANGPFVLTDENGDKLGFFTSTLDESGALIISPSIDDAIALSATYDSLVTNPSQLRNPTDPKFPLLGLLQGRDNQGLDIGPGSYNYLYLMTVDATGTPKGSSGALIPNAYTELTGIDLLVQTDIWTLETATGRLVPQWVNSDGSMITGQLYMQNGGVYVLGDPIAFQAEYPDALVPVDIYLTAPN